MRLFGKSKTGEQQTKPDLTEKKSDLTTKDGKKNASAEGPGETQSSSPGIEKPSNPKLFPPFMKKSGDVKGTSDNVSPKTTIGKSVTVTGEISGTEEIVIEGRVHGDVQILSKISVGISGVVEGKIQAQEVRISGKVNGEITALNKLEVAGTADILGQINSARLTIMEGASLEGKITMKHHLGSSNTARNSAGNADSVAPSGTADTAPDTTVPAPAITPFHSPAPGVPLTDKAAAFRENDPNPDSGIQPQPDHSTVKEPDGNLQFPLSTIDTSLYSPSSKKKNKHRR